VKDHNKTPPKSGRILYVITDLRTGGVPLHLLRLARAVRAAGYEIEVVSLAPLAEVADLMAQEGIAVFTCQARGRWDGRVLMRLRRHMARRAPDLVHALLFHANLACRISAAFAGLPPSRLLCEIQTVELERPWHLTLDRWTHRLCRWEIVNSPAVLEHLQRRARLPASRLRLVHGGVAVERFEQAQPLPRAQLCRNENELVLLWAGRLDPAKGLDELLEAVARVRRDLPVRMLLAGDGPLRDSIRRRISEMGLSDCVSLLGMRTDIPALLKSCDVFVFPSRTEGLPNALLEAMAAGCPIVCSDIPAHRHMIEDGHNGVLVAPGRPDLLAEAIAQLLRNPDTGRTYGGRARDAAAARFSQQAMFNSYLTLYAEVLDGAF
jgi:starch synthase (maltosyl-transferring)